MIEEMLDEMLTLEIPRSLMEKMIYCSKKLSEISSRELELYFYMISKSKPNAVSHVVIAHEQIVSEDSCEVSQMGKVKSYEECSEMGRVIGWAHSHAALPVFHSSRDESNLLSMLIEYPCQHPILEHDVRIMYSVVVNSFYEKPSASVGIMIDDIPYIISDISINMIDDKVYIPEPGIEDLLYERVRW